MSNHLSSPHQESTEGHTVDDAAFAHILAWYRGGVSVPEKANVPQFFLCPIGRVGAGKTTVVKPLAEKLHLVRISSDEIREYLREHGYNHLRVIELAFQLIRAFAEQGYSVAVDADCAGPNVREMIEGFAETIRARVVWIHVNPPEAFILNKLRNYPHGRLFKDADEAIASYQRRRSLHENVDYPFVYTFDPSRADLAHQIEEAASVIRAMGDERHSMSP